MILSLLAYFIKFLRLPSPASNLFTWGWKYTYAVISYMDVILEHVGFILQLGSKQFKEAVSQINI